MKKFLAFLAIAFVLITPVMAQDYGLGATADAANLKGESEPTVILGRIIGAGLSLIGIVFFILTLYAGIIWMVARGNEESAKKAINTIIAAAIGMIITMSAYAITSFILDAANQSALGSGGGGGSGPGGQSTISVLNQFCETEDDCSRGGRYTCMGIGTSDALCKGGFGAACTAEDDCGTRFCDPDLRTCGVHPVP